MRRLRLELLFSLVQVAFDYTTYAERTRTAAMLALGEVSGSGIQSLREQDWTRWWRRHEAEERGRIDAASGVEGGGAGGA